MSEDQPRIRSVYTPGANVGRYFSPEEDLSVADNVAALPLEEQEDILDGLSMSKLQYDADFWCRPSQLALINSDHWLNVALAGRGWGKSFTLAKAMHAYAMANPGCFMALVGRTTADVRDVLILGDSGLMNVIDPKERPNYRANVRRITWANGSEAMTFSAERPDGIRGPQFHAAFCDEVGSYRVNPGSGLANAFDQIKIATRLGDNPQIFVATTPRRVPAILDIVKQAEEDPAKVLLVRGSTLANRHLSETYKDVVTGLYEGTALGKQEIDGELLSDVEGALLNQDVIDNTREDHHESDFWKNLPYRVVGVDPSVSSKPNDECGIVVVGSTGERKLYKREGYVLEDASILGSPDKWAARAVEMARKYRAVIVAEDNQGGEMVKMVIQAIDNKVPVTLVRSNAGKMARAEPVGLAYERGRVHHLDWFTELEAQLTSWAPDQGMASPDRLDACLTGDSLVTMGDGTLKRLDAIAAGEFVMTRKGPRKVLAAQQTGIDRKVNILEYGDGLQLRATDNHPIWSVTRNDFVRVDQLDSDHDTVLSCTQDMNHCIKFQTPLIDLSLSSTMAQSTEEHPSPRHSDRTESITHLLEAFLSHTCTGRSALTTESMWTDFRYTTSTRILSTIRSTISSLSRHQSTQSDTMNIPRLDDSTCSTWSSPLLPKRSAQILLQEPEQVKHQSEAGSLSPNEQSNVLGAEQRSSLGTIRTKTTSAVTHVASPGTTLVQTRLNELASNAESRSSLSLTSAERCAASNVETLSCGANVSLLTLSRLRSLLTKFVNALTAAIASTPSPILPESPARDLVPLTWRKLGEETANVWNLEVEGEHEYFANGILVHNCVHALTALLVNPPKQWVSGVRSIVPGDGRALDVKNHDPLPAITAPSNRSKDVSSDKARFADVEGVRYGDVLPHDQQEIDKADVSKQRKLKQRPLSVGVGRGSVRGQSYNPPITRSRRY